MANNDLFDFEAFKSRLLKTVYVQPVPLSKTKRADILTVFGSGERVLTDQWTGIVDLLLEIVNGHFEQSPGILSINPSLEFCPLPELIGFGRCSPFSDIFESLESPTQDLYPSHPESSSTLIRQPSELDFLLEDVDRPPSNLDFILETIGLPVDDSDGVASVVLLSDSSMNRDSPLVSYSDGTSVVENSGHISSIHLHQSEIDVLGGSDQEADQIVSYSDSSDDSSIFPDITIFTRDEKELHFLTPAAARTYLQLGSGGLEESGFGCSICFSSGLDHGSYSFRCSIELLNHLIRNHTLHSYVSKSLPALYYQAFPDENWFQEFFLCKERGNRLKGCVRVYKRSDQFRQHVLAKHAPAELLDFAEYMKIFC